METMEFILILIIFVVLIGLCTGYVLSRFEKDIMLHFHDMLERLHEMVKLISTLGDTFEASAKLDLHLADCLEDIQKALIKLTDSKTNTLTN